ncbi:MAG: hypothetical protein M0018_02980, partial [Nitrospiraceae bacterium]|nr:hypothetical protein [Nitrospiraceae bacterium]
MIDYDLWGLAPFGYHLTNVLVYVASCLAFYWAVLLLLTRWRAGQEGLALIAALLFATHPAHVESVAGIAQTKDVLSGLFFFLAMGFYLKSAMGKNGKAYYALSLASCLLALLSKTTAIVFPAAIAFIEIWGFSGGQKSSWRKPVFRLVPFFIVTLAIAALNFIVASKAGVVAPPSSIASRIPVFLAAIVEYLKILVVPYPLTLWHDDMLKPSSIISALGGLRLSLLLAIVALALVFRKKAPAPTFGAALTLASLLPVSGLIDQPAAVAERYLFIPSAGFCIAAAWAIGKIMDLAAEKKGVLRRAAPLPLICLLLAYSYISFERNFDWKAGSTLAEAGLRVNPNSARLNYFLGNIYFQNGRYGHAMGRFAAAGRLDPRYNFATPFFDALYLYNRGMCGDALRSISALDMLEISDVYCLQGKIYACLGQKQQAMASARQALAARRTIGFFFRQDALALLKNK